MNDVDWTPFVMENATAFLMATRDDLLIEIEKRNRADDGKEELRAILFAPDRKVLHDEIIPDNSSAADDGIGPCQRLTLQTQVDRQGLYGVMITTAGPSTTWRLRTNCQSYMLETWHRGAPLTVHDADPRLALYRRLITPYQRTIYGEPGKEDSIAFILRNDRIQPLSLGLNLEFPGATWQVAAAMTDAELEPESTTEIVLHFRVPAAQHTVHLRVRSKDDPDFSTYATLTVLPGIAPAADPLNLPLELTPFRHENEQLGYLPADYPTENQPYFDLANRPFIRTSQGITAWRDGQWNTAGPRLPASNAHIGPWTKIAFDQDGDVYVSAMLDETMALLHSCDGGSSFKTCSLPGEDKLPAEGKRTNAGVEARINEIEVFSGHNVLNDPPPVLRYCRQHSDPELPWRKYGDLELILANKVGDAIEWESPIRLTSKSLGMSSHSGMPATVVSRGTKVHVVWGEATASDADIRTGVPVYAITYDRQARRLGKPVPVGTGRPANDMHNTPSLTIDSKGYLHVLTGAHGSQFYYARSIKPNDTQAGFTNPEEDRECLSQTYIGLVCGPDDTLHLAYREWRSYTSYFPNSNMAVLAYMSKPSGKPWSEPRTLVTAPFCGYSVYFHRLTIDRRGRLFLSYEYQAGHRSYGVDRAGPHRALMMSPNVGNTWKLVTNTANLLGREVD